MLPFSSPVRGADESSGDDESRIPAATPIGAGGTQGGGAVPGTGGTSVGVGTGGTGVGVGTGGMGTGVDIGPSHVVIVAHQDDDLLFINPELKRAIDRGDALTTAYITSGNAGMDMTYVLEREAGIKSAYAFMAQADNSWTCGAGSYGGKAITDCSLVGDKDVKLLFYRLVDGWGDGSDPNSIMRLWQGTIPSSAAVDGSGLSFTRDELVNSLADVLNQRGATHVHTTDFSFQNRANDHSDHEYAALFTVAASGAYSGTHNLSSYITYGTQSMAENLSATDIATVRDTFGFYASCDKELDGCTGGSGCDLSMCSTTSSLYISWFSRLYEFARRTTGVTATLNANSGSCLNAAGATATAGGCAGATNWTWGHDYTLRTPEGTCLTAGSLASSKALTVTACTGSDHQRWFVMDNGQVNLGAAPSASDNGGYAIAQCLDSTSGTAAVADCNGAAGQTWTL